MRCRSGNPISKQISKQSPANPMTTYDFHQGTTPLLISIPHAGTQVPPQLLQRFSSVACALPDTDWYVDRLYEFARGLGASIIKANCSRYVVDLNRAPDSAALYVSSPTSPVCPTLTFSGEAIYERGDVPDELEIRERVEDYWQPYHQCIARELARIRSGHGMALLWDAHSIASEVPALFPGALPEFNLGTRDAASCPDEVAESLLRLLQADGKYSVVLNGRFKGGYITQAYGKPVDQVYAVQLELAQRTYMKEAPTGPWEPVRARAAGRLIEQLLLQYLSFVRR